MTTPLIEAIARAMWDDRERTFPPFTRMKWENGTDIARETTTGYVAAVMRALDALGYAIVPREPTDAQVIAMHDVVTDPDWRAPYVAEIYRAMIADAPSLDTKEGE